MSNLFPNNSVLHITNGMIEDITSDRTNTLVTVSYPNRVDNRRGEQTIRLVVGNTTVILDETGNRVRPNALSTGMTINAVVSSAMTRSIPPQARAFRIRILRRPREENTTTGRILEINNQNRSFTTIRDGNLNSIIQFNLADNVRILDRQDRPADFSRLNVGQQVRVRHANFMTASIPPQTTAFEVRIL